jgi:hypothetical protein
MKCDEETGFQILSRPERPELFFTPFFDLSQVKNRVGPGAKTNPGNSIDERTL